jgi:hypothetical protein
MAYNGINPSPWRYRIMSDPTPERQAGQDEEARRFEETLRKTGQLVDVAENADTTKLPARVTHVRYPDGTVKRIRFTGTPRF